MYNHLLRYHEENRTLIIVPALSKNEAIAVRDGFEKTIVTTDSRATQVYWHQSSGLEASEIYKTGVELLKDIGRTAIPSET